MDELLLLGLIMTSGFVAGSVAERAGIPRIAAYVAVGALFSESLAGSWIPAAPSEWGDIVTDGALGVIAFLIGAEIDTDSIRRQARPIAGVVLGQSTGVLLSVTVALALVPDWLPEFIRYDVGWSAAFVFSVLAVATAPAATLAVIEEFRADGSLTTTLLGIIAIDDALAVALFALAIGLVGEAGFAAQAAEAAREIGLALIVGVSAGAALGWFARQIHQGDLRLPIIIAVVLLNTGLSGQFGYTDLLSNIVMGYVAMRAFRGGQKTWLEPMQHVRDEDLNQVTWEQRVMKGDPKAEMTQRLPNVPYHEFARLIGLDGIFVDEPDALGAAWDRALSSGRPTVLEVKTDPEVPPLPPHIKFDQAKQFMSAAIEGGTEELGMVKGAAKQVMSKVFSQE